MGSTVDREFPALRRHRLADAGDPTIVNPARLDAKDPEATKFCAMAKRFVTDVGFKVANDALQIHGGYGYLSEYEIERIVRDLRVHQILEGTNEIMRVIIARRMLDGDAPDAIR